MTEPGFDADALIDATLPLLGLALPEGARPVLKLHLETAERLARLVVEFPLDDESEPAPVFTP
ncbi:MAG TPA: DUF4089 domain-containing protein [Roseiarcus sp.]|nr:DUF4089 domain-containing protein [Roseiarcus sp.]